MIHATKLERLHTEHGQSPWLDNLTRGHLCSGGLQRLIHSGIGGVTSNPTIFAKAIGGSADYDDQFRDLVRSGATVIDADWAMFSLERYDEVIEAFFAGARVLLRRPRCSAQRGLLLRHPGRHRNRSAAGGDRHR